MDETLVSRGNAYSDFMEDVYKAQPKQKSIEELEKIERSKSGKSKNKTNQRDNSRTPNPKDSRGSKELRGTKGNQR